jgi:hypothetical protein
MSTATTTKSDSLDDFVADIFLDNLVMYQDTCSSLEDNIRWYGYKSRLILEQPSC